MFIYLLIFLNYIFIKYIHYNNGDTKARKDFVKKRKMKADLMMQQMQYTRMQELRSDATGFVSEVEAEEDAMMSPTVSKLGGYQEE